MKPFIPSLALIALLATALAGCGRDAPSMADPIDPVDAPIAEAATPSEPEGSAPDLRCGAQRDLQSRLEVLGTPAAGGRVDVRLRWTGAEVDWTCCPYQPMPAASLAGAGVIERQVASSDAAGSRLDLVVAIDPDAAGEALEVRLFAGCATAEAHRLVIAEDPTASRRAALDTCEAPESHIDFDDQQARARLRITRFDLEGDFVPGATVIARVEMAEVAGVGHGGYPGVLLEADSDQLGIEAGLGQLYATFACDAVQFELPVTLPADLPVGEVIALSAAAGGPLCPMHAECTVHDRLSLTRRVLPPR